MWFDRNMLSLDLHKIPFWCLEPAIKKKKREDQVKDTWFASKEETQIPFWVVSRQELTAVVVLCE